MSWTGAELLVAGLEAAGVDVVFGLPGVHNLAAWEALRESPIRLVGVRHEQAAVYAADGYARASGRVGVALVTTGPGAANTLGACGEAWASRSPVLVVATDIPTGLRTRGVHRGVLHECVDQRGMFVPVTKQQFTPATFAELALAAFAAPDAATRAPARPVYLEIPTDLLSASGARNASSASSVNVCGVKRRFVTGSNIPGWSTHSCSTPRCTPRIRRPVGMSVATTSTGERLAHASPHAASVFAAPGPVVTSATPSRPVTRA